MLFKLCNSKLDSCKIGDVGVFEICSKFNSGKALRFKSYWGIISVYLFKRYRRKENNRDHAWKVWIKKMELKMLLVKLGIKLYYTDTDSIKRSGLKCF